MTKQECAIIQAYTGVCMLQGEDLEIYYTYIKNLLNRPVLTHEIPELFDDIRELAKEDFIFICENAFDANNLIADLIDYLGSDVEDNQE